MLFLPKERDEGNELYYTRICILNVCLAGKHMAETNLKGFDEINDALMEQIRTGGATARNIVFGVAQRDLKEGRIKETVQWLKGAFYALPEQDQRLLLVQLIANFPSDTVQ